MSFAIASFLIRAHAIASLTCMYRHDEENKLGLYVRNRSGDTWIIYGDGRYFNSLNLRNADIAKTAVTESLKEISACFNAGATPKNFGSSPWNYSPTVLSTGHSNHAPMFKIVPNPIGSGTHMQYRYPVNNPVVSVYMPLTSCVDVAAACKTESQVLQWLASNVPAPAAPAVLAPAAGSRGVSPPPPAARVLT